MHSLSCVAASVYSSGALHRIDVEGKSGQEGQSLLQSLPFEVYWVVTVCVGCSWD